VRGCLFTLLLGAVVVALVVYLGLPAIASGLVAAGLATAGLQAEDTTVVVQSDPPTDLLSGHADRVVVHATDASFRGLAIGSLDLALEDVDVLGRTAGSVDGTLTDVTLPAESGGARLRTVAISGGGEELTAATTIGKADAEALVADAVERTSGVRPTEVTLTSPDRVVVRISGQVVRGRLRAEGGDIVVGVTDGPGAGTDMVMVRGGEDLPMEITKVRINDSGGLRVEGELAIRILG
jgi:hypothetical protein